MKLSVFPKVTQPVIGRTGIDYRSAKLQAPPDSLAHPIYLIYLPSIHTPKTFEWVISKRHINPELLIISNK